MWVYEYLIEKGVSKDFCEYEHDEYVSAMQASYQWFTRLEAAYRSVVVVSVKCKSVVFTTDTKTAKYPHGMCTGGVLAENS